MTQFFNKFPTVTYSNTIARNLLSRVSMSKIALNDKQAFYVHTTKECERPDNLSYNYYDNADYVWLIALTNQVIDPYYDFAVSEDNLNSLLINKYGSLLEAQNLILFFQNNYANDDSNITVSAYNALGVNDASNTNLKKYWTPQIGYNNQIVGYVRKQENWTVTTNQIQQLTISTPTVNFIPNERLLQSGQVVATVGSYQGTTLVVKHVYTIDTSGYLSVETGLTLLTDETSNLNILQEEGVLITGESSGATAFILSSNLITQNIPDAELIYWSPITAYEYEHGINTKNKQIQLLDNRYAGQATKQLKTLLSQ